MFTSSLILAKCYKQAGFMTGILNTVTNFHLYTYYLMNMAQLTVLKLLEGMNNLELNIDKISKYLQIMATHKATPIVIPPEALHTSLGKVTHELRPKSQLRLPFDPEGMGIWKYYNNLRVYLVLLDNMLVIFSHLGYHSRTKYLPSTQPASHPPWVSLGCNI